jgi:hypothetical protein
MPRIDLATVPICFSIHLFGFPRCQGSSVVEQGTHKPLVGSSTLPPGTPEISLDTLHYNTYQGLKTVWLFEPADPHPRWRERCERGAGRGLRGGYRNPILA